MPSPRCLKSLAGPPRRRGRFPAGRCRGGRLPGEGRCRGGHAYGQMYRDFTLVDTQCRPFNWKITFSRTLRRFRSAVHRYAVSIRHFRAHRRFTSQPQQVPEDALKMFETLAVFDTPEYSFRLTQRPSLAPLRQPRSTPGTSKGGAAQARMSPQPPTGERGSPPPHKGSGANSAPAPHGGAGQLGPP